MWEKSLNKHLGVLFLKKGYFLILTGVGERMTVRRCLRIKDQLQRIKEDGQEKQQLRVTRIGNEAAATAAWGSGNDGESLGVKAGAAWLRSRWDGTDPSDGSRAKSFIFLTWFRTVWCHAVICRRSRGDSESQEERLKMEDQWADGSSVTLFIRLGLKFHWAATGEVQSVLLTLLFIIYWLFSYFLSVQAEKSEMNTN